MSTHNDVVIGSGGLVITMHPDRQPGIVAIRVHDVLWGTASSSLFRIDLGDQIVTALTPGVHLTDIQQTHDGAGMQCTTFTYDTPQRIQITQTFKTYAGTHLLEAAVSVVNRTNAAVTIHRIDTLVIDIPTGSYESIGYSGGWGSEFEPKAQRLIGDVVWQTRSGRSSHGMHPWVGLTRDQRALLSVSVVWSGNWIIRADEQPAGGYQLSAGLNDWAFHTTLAPGATTDAPAVVAVFGANPSLDDNAAAYAAVGRSHWYPKNTLSTALPVEWNHWWTYEDRAITEQTFRANVDVAAQMGMEVCALDAGWFGPSDPGTHWYDYRGDWHIVNTTRFPSGIRALSDYVHAKGMAFGLWCEIEALGVRAEAGLTNPAIVARRDDTPCGYVCLASAAGWDWAFATLDRLITDYRADWIKLDFNLDPGAGCNRTDHGHGAGDGLHGHYQGYYRLLAAIRAKHPEVVLENCSSGGLRIDLGIAQQTHMAFLSDPDWPEHSLQLFWGASSMLAPDAILHWGFCEWGFADHPQQTFDPTSAAVTASQLDYYTRISMLHRFGFSQGLPTLLPWIRDRYVQHIDIYKTVVRRFVRTAQLHRLTNQPRRDGTLDRYAGFQYIDHTAGDMLVAFFRLPGAKPKRRFWLHGIDPLRSYRCTWLGDNRVATIPGAVIAAGWMVDDLGEPGSALIHIQTLPKD
jgi:alpha-galactosidase